MKLLKNITLALIFILLLCTAGIYGYLETRMASQRKQVFNALSLFQKAYAISKLDSEKMLLSEVMDEIENLDMYFARYDFENLKHLTVKMNDTATQIIERRKNTISSGAHIANVVGDADFVERGTQLLKAEANINIKSGDILTLKEDSACKIILIDGSTLSMNYPSSVVFNMVEANKDAKTLQISITLNEGGIQFSTSKMTNYQPEFEIKAKGINAEFSRNTDGAVNISKSPFSVDVLCYDGSITAKKTNYEKTIPVRQMARYSGGSLQEQMYAIPASPRIEEPSNFKTFELKSQDMLTFRWRPVFKVVGYYFEISTDPLFAMSYYKRKNYSGTNLKIPLPETGEYYWRVAALNEVNETGSFSDMREFKIVQTREHNLLADKTPPPLTLEKVRVFGQTAIIRGKTEQKAFVTVNNQIVDVKEDGSFSAIIEFYQAGKNKVEVISRDSSDNETVVTKWVSIRIY